MQNIATLAESEPTSQDQTAIETLAAHAQSVREKLVLQEPEEGWSKQVSDVVVILSASRSGSSLLYKALTSDEHIVAPAGEPEPWLYLSGNKHPFVDSDQILSLNNPNDYLTFLRNDLLVRKSEVSGGEFADLMWNRLVVRGLETRPEMQELITRLRTLPIIDTATYHTVIEEMRLASTHQQPITELADVGHGDRILPIENPPYIDQPLARRAQIEELRSKTLLFKSPPDTYRPGLYESLFPNATIRYIHLTRGFVQTINGLMDGWSKNETDFISNAIGLTDDKLNIEDYSATDITKTHWCFDLFPTWQAYIGATLVEVCAQQWLQAHSGVRQHFPVHHSVQFEQFYTDRDAFCATIKTATGVDLANYDWSEQVMSTEKPSQFRWLKRIELFRNIGKYIAAKTLHEITAMQKALGYSMEESTWH